MMERIVPILIREDGFCRPTFSDNVRNPTINSG